MSRIFQLADAVTAALNDFDFSLAFTAARVRAVSLDLKDVRDVVVRVVPRGVETSLLARKIRQHDQAVAVVVMKKLIPPATGDDPTLEEQIETLSGLVEEIDDYLFATGKLGGAGPPIESDFNPIWNSDHLTDRGQFTSVNVITYRGSRETALPEIED